MSDKTIFIRLLVAFILGAIIGTERTVCHKPAGIKTYIAVSIGSALTMLFGIYMSETFPGTDPTRMSAQVVSGIGFLGALCVLKDQSSIVGITTASSIWVMACIGLAVGGGFISGACIATAFIMIDFIIIPRLNIPKYRKHNGENDEENE